MSEKRFDIAIIGAGAAGAMSAHQLRKRLGADANIVVYERLEHGGGRAKDIEFGGIKVEMGGAVLHSSGLHTMELMELTGCKEGVPGVSCDGDNETYAFWTGSEFPVFTGTSLASMAAGIVKHVGPASALRITSIAKDMSVKWDKLYDIQKKGTTFDTTDEFMAALGLLEETKVSLAEFLRKNKINQRMATDIVEPITHNMYNQGLEMNAFAGLVGLAGAGLAGGYLFAIEGGNWTLLDKAVRAQADEVRFNTAVTSVNAKGEAGYGRRQFTVTTEDGQSDEYDLVILAAPPAMSRIAVSQDGTPVDIAVHPYQEVHTTLVAGDLNPAFFLGGKQGKLPSTVFTATAAQAPFMSVGVTGYSEELSSRVYKIFSGEHQVTEEEMSRIFLNVIDTTTHVWRGAYPVLTPGIEHVPFQLLPDLYYGCALETAAGSIEVEAVGGVNASNMAVEYLLG